uniref:Ig-like domain-containing protein n=1 Tax=Cyprinodon variegatus TaxID=28743 RepID=A0A3Q2CKR7_CYPVA
MLRSVSLVICFHSSIFLFFFIPSLTCCTEDFKFEVKTVPPGQNVTLTCPRQSSVLYQETLYWIRLVSGKWPEFLGATFNFMGDEDSKNRHIQTKQDRGEFLLDVTEAQQNDTGLYYCIKYLFSVNLMFNNFTSLLIRKNSDVSVVLQKPPSGPGHPENPKALQCSVLSNSERSTCPADNRVYWFKAGSDDSHPSLLYLQGNSLEECDNSLEAPSIQKCFYNFSETVDPGTYYCAVAACGQILFGNGTKLHSKVILTFEHLVGCGLTSSLSKINKIKEVAYHDNVADTTGKLVPNYVGAVIAIVMVLVLLCFTLLLVF